MFAATDDRYEDGQGSTSGSGGVHKRVAWNSRVRFFKEDPEKPKDDEYHDALGKKGK